MFNCSYQLDISTCRPKYVFRLEYIYQPIKRVLLQNPIKRLGHY